MIRFAALLSQGTLTPDILARHAETAGPEDAAAARALLSGTRPKRLVPAATLLAWVAGATQTPAFLIDACRRATPDLCELAALLLPPATGEPPTLTEVLANLTTPEAYLTLARRLPPEARLILNRIASGTFRTRLTEPVLHAPSPGTCLAILTLIDPSGPTATFALPFGNGLAPLCRLRLTLAETPALLTWARANTTDRFGPQRQVAPVQVFEIGFDGTTPNARRKCGFDLVEPRLIAWRQAATPDAATPVAALLAR